MTSQLAVPYNVVRFATQEDWLDHRNQGVGGSDMATILGINPYKTPLQLWQEKTGVVQREDISGKWSVERGNALESHLLDHYAAKHPEFAVESGTGTSLVNIERPYMRASLDGIATNRETGESCVVEIKTVGARRVRDWEAEDGGWKVPAYYLAQVQFYLAVTGWKHAYVYADLNLSDPIEIRVDRDEEDIQLITDAAEDFWRHVQENEPVDVSGVIDVMSLYPQDNGDLITTDDQEFDRLAAEYETCKANERRYHKDAETVKDLLAARIGENKGLVSSQWQVTYATQTRKEHMVKASTSRVMRIKKINNN